MSTKDKGELENFKLRPLHLLKKGDLVRVKDFEPKLGGQIGLILSKEDYNTACVVLFSNGMKKKMMKMCLEKADLE